MVQAAEPGEGSDIVPSGTPSRGSTGRRVLGEPQERPVFLVIANLVTHEALEMSFIEDDDMIQQGPPTTTNPAFGYSVLPRTSQGCPYWTASHILGGRDYILARF